MPPPGRQSLLDVTKQRGATTFHPMGTCKMGSATDPMSVVDDQMWVHAPEGLRVINASTMMIGEKGSDLIRGREPLPSAAV